MKTTLLVFVAAVTAQPDPRGRRFQPEPTYSPETPFRDNVPAPVFGAGHSRPSFQPPRFWGNQKEPQRYQSPWDQQQSQQQQQQRPFGNFERGPGRDSREEDGRDSEPSGGRDREGPSKVVGVNMQMVAGMYPDGRFSPLSGPYEDQRREGGDDRSRTRGPPFRQGPFRGDSEAGSHPPRGFFGPKPTSRDNQRYESEERRREFDREGRRPEEPRRGEPRRPEDSRQDRRPEEPRHPEDSRRPEESGYQKYKPDEDVEESFRDTNKGGRLHLGRKRPDDEREVAEQPEDVGRFRIFHKEEDRLRYEEPRKESREGRDREEQEPKEDPKLSKPLNLVDGDAGIPSKAEDDKRTTLPEEPLTETTSLSNTTTVSE